MGYFTQHTLTARRLRNEDQFNELQKELNNRELIHYALNDGDYNDRYKEAEFPCYDEAKWYEHSKDMVMISERFPNVYFELYGEGEEHGDYWKEYYHDGECEFCRGEIVYEQPKKVQWNDLLVNF